ncbi:hypothetical protein H9P43_001240 [Blastocladiella emersonii ATCC 22665]|nr:hypothetical protein H9P43_001240 [Blastocladiella emersonii ATCC 22665]
MASQEAFVSVRLNDTNVVAPSRRDKSGFMVKAKNWFVNEGTKRFCFTLFIASQLYLFFNTFIYYKFGKDFVTVQTLVGDGIATAKSAAACLNLDCGIILFPVCRTIISRLRVSFLNNIIPFDKNITFHRYVAYSIVLFTWIHAMAHYWNYRMLGLATKHTAEWYAVISGPGLTGQVATLALFLMATSAAETVRRAHHEIFWYTHHLFLVFFAALLPHGAFCFVKADKPPFCAAGGNFWKYFVGSGVLYMIERVVRELRGRRETYISKVIFHPGDVLELQIQKPSATMRAGQYIWINCPAISPFQWHPFTLTAAPQEGFLSVHIRLTGDWTKAMANQCGITLTKDDKNLETRIGRDNGLPRIMVDGPYGAASEDWMNFEVIMLVGAGIGVTPFASILKSIFYHKKQGGGDRLKHLRKVYFIWTNRDMRAFEWFQTLLLTIEKELQDLVEIHMYLTGSLKPDQITNVMIHDMTVGRDALSGLQSLTFYGRPSWDAIFTGLKVSHPETDVGVFYCGPKQLSEVLHKMSNKHTDTGGTGVRFYYNKGGKGKGGKGKKKGKKGKTDVVRLTDEEFKLFILALKVESKSQAVAFYRNWCKEQSIDLKILHQKVSLTRKRHNNHLKNLNGQGDLFESSYGPYVFVRPLIPILDPAEALPKPPAAATTGHAHPQRSGGGDTKSAAITKSANSTTGASTRTADAKAAPSTRTTHGGKSGSKLASVVRKEMSAASAVSAMSGSSAVSSRSSGKDGGQPPLEPEPEPDVPRAPPIPVAIPGAKRYDGTAVAATVPAPELPPLERDPRIAKKMEAVQALRNQRAQLLADIAQLDAECTRLHAETDPHILEELKCKTEEMRRQIQDEQDKLAQYAADAEARHQEALQQTEAHALEQIKDVNQIATEFEVKNMSPLHSSIVEKHLRFQRELASVRDQEVALTADVSRAEHRLAGLIRRSERVRERANADLQGMQALVEVNPGTASRYGSAARSRTPTSPVTIGSASPKSLRRVASPDRRPESLSGSAAKLLGSANALNDGAPRPARLPPLSEQFLVTKHRTSSLPAPALIEPQSLLNAVAAGSGVGGSTIMARGSMGPSGSAVLRTPHLDGSGGASGLLAAFSALSDHPHMSSSSRRGSGSGSGDTLRPQVSGTAETLGLPFALRSSPGSRTGSGSLRPS